jgi:hypothetical protein
MPVLPCCAGRPATLSCTHDEPCSAPRALGPARRRATGRLPRHVAVARPARAGGSCRFAGRGIAAPRPGARRPRRAVHGQRPGDAGADVGLLVGGAGHRADQPEAAPEGGAVHRGAQRGVAAGHRRAHRPRPRGGGPGAARLARCAGRGRRRAPRMDHGDAARRAGRPRTRRPRVAVLHVGHHRPPQGRDAHAPQPAGDDAVLLRRRGRRTRRRRCAVRGADVARRGALRAAARGGRRAPRGAGVARLRPGGDPDARAPPSRRVDVRGADDGAPAGRARVANRRRRRRAEDHRLRRRADVRGGHPARAARAGAALRADLRAGREPDDDHRAVTPAHRRQRASPLAGAATR